MAHLLLILTFLCLGAPSLWADVPNNPVLNLSSQVLVVEPVKGSIFKAKLTVWQRQDKKWKQVFDAMDAVVGRNGIAAIGQKQEGDGQTPSGIFDLRRAFGYDATMDTKMNYQQVTKDDIWVDDSNSRDYNQWINLKDLTDAKSFEQMKRDDDLYKTGIVIEYNTDPVVVGLGSAIFLHIWRNFESPTAGCVALSEEDIFKLLKWLDPLSHPMIIIQ